MNNAHFSHSDESILADLEAQRTPKTPSIPPNPPSPPDPPSFDLEIDAPGGIGVRLKAQGSATVAAVVVLLMAGLSIGLGGSALLNNDQPKQPSIERREQPTKPVD